MAIPVSNPTQQTPPTPPAASPQDPLDRIVEGNQDLIGKLALSLMLISLADKQEIGSLLEKKSLVTQSQIEIFREAALASINNYTDRAVSRKIDSMRSEISNSAYHEVMKSYFDNLIREHSTTSENIISEIKSSAGTSRQIIVSVIASFVFGLVIAAASVVDNPFGPVIKASQTQLPVQGGKSGEAASDTK